MAIYQIKSEDQGLGAFAQRLGIQAEQVLEMNKNNPAIQGEKLVPGGKINIPDTETKKTEETKSIIGDDKTKTGVKSSEEIENKKAQEKFDQALKDQENLAELQRLRVLKEIADTKKTLEGGATRPSTFEHAQTFEDLYGKQGMGDIQNRLNTIQSEKADLMAGFEAFRRKEPIGTVGGFAQGRILEEQRNVMDRIDFLTRQETSLTNQLNTKNNYINTVMNLKQMDYNAASDLYDKTFNQNYQIFSAVMAKESQDIQIAHTQVKTIIDAIKDHPDMYKNPSENDVAQWNSIELRTGLPQGFIKASALASSKFDVSHWVKGDNGQVYVYGTNKSTGESKLLQTLPGPTLSPLTTSLKNLQIERGKQMIETSKALEANRIIGSQVRADPVMKRYNEAIAVQPRIDAAINKIQSEGVNDPNTKELLDASTQLMTGGQQITEGQIYLNTQFQSYYSQLKVWQNKFKKEGGGAISQVVANQIIDLVNETYKLYEQSYKQRITKYQDRLANVYGQDLREYSPLTDMSNLPNVMSGVTDKNLQTQQGILQGIDLSTLDSDQLQTLIDEGLIQQ